ncbi:ABC transporter transmembrane domain-containing protein [Gemmata sp.]|uniref:ABC transporter transmembrane domain-containing protein n=1 Tax=Gemmata sp. TaxID=1914242 RepID=UPI003F70AD9E
MRNFLRILRYSWPYRYRLLASVGCALMVAALWSLNLSAIYPVLKILSTDKNLHQWVDSEIENYQQQLDNRARLKRLEELHVLLKEIEQNPNKSQTETVERKATEELAKLEGERSDLATWVYRYQWIKAKVMRHVPEDRFETFVWLLAIVIVGLMLKGAFEFTHEALVGSVTNHTLFDLRNGFFRRALHQDVRQLAATGTAELMARFTNDTEQVGTGLKVVFGRMVGEPLKAVACFVVSCVISWQLTLVFVLLVPLTIVCLVRVSKMMRKAAKKVLERMSAMYKVVRETFDGVRAVKGFTREPHQRRRFRAASRDFMQKAMRMIYIDAATGPIVEVLVVAAISLALASGTYLVVTGNTHIFGFRMTGQPLEFATLLQLYAFLAATADPVRRLTSVYTKVQVAEAAANRIFELYDRMPAVTANPNGPRLFEVRAERAAGRAAARRDLEASLRRPPTGAELAARLGVPLAELEGSIEFRNVCFSYDPVQATLSNVSFTVRAGETVAIVGGNGSGKTTLLGLLMRFYDPDHGAVLIDGVNLRVAHLRSLRKMIGLVTQDTQLFDGSVFDNIAFGKRGATRAEVEEAAKKAHAHDFITAKPHGYDAPMGEGVGIQFSGGEKQKIALARAILRDPSVLILDEFTSQIDAASENDIHTVLKEFVKGRTVFLITHKLHTLEIADRIVVMDAGMVVDIGTHPELVARCPFYQRLCDPGSARKAA